MKMKMELTVLAQKYNVEAAVTTPWGRSQDATKLLPGLIWYDTAGHGGLYVSQAVANKSLSAQARKNAIKYAGGYWYEEDCGWAIPMYENPEWGKIFRVKMGGKESTREELKQLIERWIPEYFKDAEAEVMEFKNLKVGDLIYVDSDSMPYALVSIAGNKAVISREGKNYRFSKASYFSRVRKVERNGKELTK